jgi:hypothetical protein
MTLQLDNFIIQDSQSVMDFITALQLGDNCQHSFMYANNKTCVISGNSSEFEIALNDETGIMYTIKTPMHTEYINDLYNILNDYDTT